MKALALAALVGVIHVHHAPSHDSGATFEEVLAAADQAGLDFVVLTDHADVDAPGPLPAIEHAGVQRRRRAAGRSWCWSAPSSRPATGTSRGSRSTTRSRRSAGPAAR